MAEITEAPKKKTKTENFYFGTGRRKTAVARVRLTLGKGEILINDKSINDVFIDPVSRKIIDQPLNVVDRAGGFSGTVKLSGGGIKAQAEALAHGLSRALVAYDEALRAPLAKAGLMTRDPRMKERRKYGLGGKARKGKQSPKR
jgi:small subunit ribosomal protein S9